MYDELIKSLRICSRCDFGQDCNGCTQESDDAFCCDKLLSQAADAIETLSMKLHGDEAAIVGMKREIERMVVAGKPRWIPVSERLPEKNGSYLVYVYGEVTEMEYWHGKWHRLRDDYTKAVTHWMPLPPAPEPTKEKT